jgi:hypothetical protein
MFGGFARSRVLEGKWLVVLVGVSAGCSLFGSSSKQYDDDDNAGNSSGGTKSSGGSSGTKSSGGSSTGGTTSSGGSGATGGSSKGGSTSSGGSGATGGSSKGGSTSSGGSTSTGGSDTTGGSTSSGGDAGTGGAKGGSTSTGGDAGTGGSSGGSGGKGGSGGSGGSVSSGGSSGSGGSAGSVDCGTEYATHAGGYVTAPGTSGCWHGFAYTVSDALGSSIAPTDFSTCTDGCSLCAAGVIPSSTGYSGWAGLGVTINQADMDGAPTGTVTPTGSYLTVTFDNPGGSELRIQIQNDTTQWCAPLTGAGGSVKVPYANFNTECWTGGSGTPYSGQAITGVQLVVPGSELEDTVFEMCLTGVKDT